MRWDEEGKRVQKLRLNKFVIFFYCSLVSAVLWSSHVPTSVFANPGVSLTPFESIKIDVAPGETLTHQMTLQLGQQNVAMDMAVDVLGYGSSLDGIPQGIDPSKDASPYSARGFVTIDKHSFRLQPGGTQEITATISVPSNVGNGGRYAIIYIHEQPPAGDGGTGSLSAFNIPVLLTIKGSTLSHMGKITEITAGKVVSGQSIEIFTSFQNTGNHHFKVTGEVTVTNSRGDLLDTIPVPLSTSSIIPTTLRQTSATFIPKETLPLGVYSLKSRLILEDGTTLVSASGSFEVKDSYVPPAPTSVPPSSTLSITPTPAPSTISIMQPSTASTLPVTSQTFPAPLVAGVAVGAAILITVMVMIGRKRK